MKIKDNKGSITIFVLVGLLFMSSFLLISYANNINKSKVAKEQLNIISGIYSHGDGDANAYNRAYTALRKESKQILTYDSSSEGLTTVKEVILQKTYEEKVSNYRIYGSSSGLGNLVTDISDSNYGRYKIDIKVSNEAEEKVKTYAIYLNNVLHDEEYIDFSSQKLLRNDEPVYKVTMPEIQIYEDYTKFEILTTYEPSRIQIDYEGYTFE